MHVWVRGGLVLLWVATNLSQRAHDGCNIIHIVRQLSCDFPPGGMGRGRAYLCVAVTHEKLGAQYKANYHAVYVKNAGLGIMATASPTRSHWICSGGVIPVHNK